VNIRKRLQLFVDDYVREEHPKLWKVLAPAAGSRVPPDDRVTEALLAPVVAAVADTRASVARPAHYVLWVLTDHFTAARQAVSRMLQDSRGHVRTWAMLCVGEGAPRPFQLDVLRRGLSDRCAPVRRQAANRAWSYRLRELLPEMEAAAARERNAKVRWEIDCCLRLLRDGYSVTPSTGGQVVLTVALDDGGIGSRFVSRTELKSRGVETVASELRAKLSRRRQA
jgi:hypothetical protein